MQNCFYNSSADEDASAILKENFSFVFLSIYFITLHIRLSEGKQCMPNDQNRDSVSYLAESDRKYLQTFISAVEATFCYFQKGSFRRSTISVFPSV